MQFPPWDVRLRAKRNRRMRLRKFPTFDCAFVRVTFRPAPAFCGVVSLAFTQRATPAFTATSAGGKQNGRHGRPDCLATVCKPGTFQHLPRVPGPARTWSGSVSAAYYLISAAKYEVQKSSSAVASTLPGKCFAKDPSRYDVLPIPPYAGGGGGLPVNLTTISKNDEECMLRNGKRSPALTGSTFLRG